jgi:hypothetical protein
MTRHQLTIEEAEAVCRLHAERNGEETMRLGDLAEALRIPRHEAESLLAEVRGVPVIVQKPRPLWFDHSAMVSGAIAAGVCAVAFAGYLVMGHGQAPAPVQHVVVMDGPDHGQIMDEVSARLEAARARREAEMMAREVVIAPPPPEIVIERHWDRG